MAKSNSEPFIVTDDEREEILSRKKTHVFYDEWCDWIIGFSSEDAGEIAKGLAFAFRGEEYESSSQMVNILLKNAVRIIRENREDYVIATAKKIRGAKNRFAESDDGVPMDIHSISNATPKDIHSISNGVPMDKDGVSVLVPVPVIDSVSVIDNVLDLNDNAEKKEDAKASKKEVRHKYGQYENVLLSDTDMDKLKDEFPMDWQERIERLSEYIESKGAKYKNHLATIRAWARKNNDRKRPARSALGDILNDMPFDSSGDITGSKVWEVFNK